MRSYLAKLTGQPALLVLPLAVIVLYFDSFVPPYTPIYQGDSSPIFISEAVRMLRGERIYDAFFELTLPGTQVVYLAIFKVLGVRGWIPSAMFVVLGVGLAWTGTAIANRIMPAKFAILPGLTFLAFGFTTEPDATHHWCSTLAVMGALLILLERRSSRRLAGAGILCGLATAFTQNRGIAAVLGTAVYLLWEAREKRRTWRALLKSELCLCVPFLVVIFGVLAYLASTVGWRTLVYSTIVFPFRYYPLWFWNKPEVYLSEVPVVPVLLEIPAVSIWLVMYALVPGIYLLFLVRRARLAPTHPDEPWDKLMLLAVVGISLFLSISFSASWLRLCSVCLPALVILAWFIKTSGRLSPVLGGFLAIAALATLLGQIAAVQADWHGDLDTRVGKMAFLDPGRYEKFAWVQTQTRPGEFLFQSSDCDLYYPLDLRNPTKVPFLTASGYTRPEQVEEVVEALEKRQVRLVLWSAWLDLPRQLPFDKNGLAPIRDYLRTHYHIVRVFGGPDYEEVWQRNASSGR